LYKKFVPNRAPHLRNVSHAPAFRENDIDSELLGSLTADDLKELGIKSIGHRRKLLDAIAALRDEGAPIDGSASAARSSRSSSTDLGLPASYDIERRQVTVMFCDLMGSTALSSSLDPEDLRDIVSACRRCCGVRSSVG
jgi:hypothetical protein